MKSFVYLLRSLKNNRFYIGSTSINVKERLLKHNKGYVASTNRYRPFRLEYYQEYENIHLARIIELKLKKLKRSDYLEKIVKDQKIKMGL